MPELKKGRDNEPKVVAYLNRLLKESDSYLKSYIKNWDTFWKLYDGYRKKPNAEDWRSNVFIPTIFSAIQQILPRLVLGILGEDASFGVKPKKFRDNPDVQKRAEALRKVTDYFIEKMDFYYSFAEMVFDCCINDVAYGKVHHKHEEKKVYWYEYKSEEITEKQPLQDPETGMDVVDPETGQPVMFDVPTGEYKRVRNEESEVRTIYSGPYFETIDARDLRYTPGARSLQSAPMVAHRTWDTLDNMKRDQKYSEFKYNVGSLKDELKSSETERLEQEEGLSAHVQKKIELWEIHLDEWIITLANKKYIVRWRRPEYKHGKKPFVSMTRYFKSRSIIGKSEVNPIHSMQILINDVTNLRTDNLMIAVMRMFFLLDEDFDHRYLQMKPGGIIPPSENGTKPIEVFEPGTVDFSAYKEVETMLGHMNQATGTSDYMGAPTGISDINKTAEGARTIVNEANKRAGFWVKLSTKKTLVPILRMIAEILEQYITDEELQKILGDEWQYFRREPEGVNYEVEHDFEIQGQHMEIIDSRVLNGLQDVYAIALKDPEANRYIKKFELIEDILSKMKLNKERILRTPDELNPLQNIADDAAGSILNMGQGAPAGLPQQPPAAIPGMPGANLEQLPDDKLAALTSLSQLGLRSN